MIDNNSYSSPNILIYLDIKGTKIRLSDVLMNTASLYEPAELPPNTEATLVFSIDGRLEKQEIILNEGIFKESKLISFIYK